MFREQAMTWTTETPTQPGWYWWREYEGSGPQITQVHLFNFVWLNKPFLGIEDIHTRTPLDNMLGEWAGPLEPPT